MSTTFAAVVLITRDDPRLEDNSKLAEKWQAVMEAVWTGDGKVLACMSEADAASMLHGFYAAKRIAGEPVESIPERSWRH